ncbi:MAG: NAD(P)/FAD-dependent oxidoreductase [Pseudomonadota bacterium]
METVKTDYLVIGCGAVGMAFADTILEESDKRLLILDDRAAPGGHWNDAYPFVTLHQPSAFYGVASTELSRGRVDETGLNKGMMELATGAEVAAYFQQVLRERFLPSGRVEFRPLTRWEGDGIARDLATGETFRVEAEKIVDATYFGTNIPALHDPSFEVDEGATMIPVNELPRHVAGAEDFVIIGGGKTAMDAVIWLLENRVHPDRIRWVRNRDSYLMNRAKTQPGDDFFADTFGGQVATFEAMGAASDPDDLLDRLEAANVLLRLDSDVRPKMFHGATISEDEAAELRRVKNVIRMGYVQRVGVDEVVLDQGTIQATAKTVHVDCSACAVTKRPTVKVFDGDRITLQMIRIFQPTFSASLIAWLDVHYDDEKAKNRLSSPAPLPDKATDWIKVNVATMMNQFNWSQDKALRTWMTSNRLDGFSKVARSVDPEDAEKMAILMKMRDAAKPAMMFWVV